MIKILKSGILTTIQDQGRFGFRKYGVPHSGAMDVISSDLANALLENDASAPVIECTLVGPTIEFLNTTAFVICGADMQFKLNDQPIKLNKVYIAGKKSKLSAGKAISGMRSYIAVKGGFNVENVLGSASFCPNITKKERLMKGDTVRFKPFNLVNEIHGRIKRSLNVSERELEVFKGPEWDYFTYEQKQMMLNNSFSISEDSNRMGMRLKESYFQHDLSILTSPVLPGTVQCTPDGRLIVLMKDAQTTGGYPRIFQLTEKSLSLIAQKTAGEHITFNTIPYDHKK